MINEKEKKMIRKYSILPKISIASFIMSLVLIGVWFIMVLITYTIFGDNHGYDAMMNGLRTFLILFGIDLIIFLYSYLSTYIGMNKKSWKKIVEKVAVEQDNTDYSAQIVGSVGLSSVGSILKGSNNEITKNIGKTAEVVGTVGTVVTTTAIIDKMAKNADSVAKVGNIKIPKARNYIIPLIIIPILILIASYIQAYSRAKDTLENEKKVVSETVYKLQSAFKKECEIVRIDDPYELVKDTWYNVRAELSENNYIYITVENDGKIEEIVYYGHVDTQISKDENIENVEKIYSQLHKLLVDSGVDLTNNMIQTYKLSEEFKEKFLKTPYNEKFYVHESSTIRIFISS